MKIAVVVGSFPELSTTFIMDQITGLLDRGHDVHVFARTPPHEEPVHAAFHSYGLAQRTHYWWGTPEVRRKNLNSAWRLLVRAPRKHAPVLLRSIDPLRAPFSIRRWSYATVLLEHGPFDCVLAQFGVNGRIAQQLRALGAFDAPIATTWLGYDLTRVVREHGAQHYAELFASGDLMLPLSRNFSARLAKLGCPTEKLSVHHIGVDLSQYQFKPRVLNAGEPVKIVSVCRLVEKKGLDVALAALARVAASGARFEYHLVGDGPERAELERLIDQYDLRARTTCYGSRTREELRAILADGHLFLSPSVTARDGDEEGTPTAIMEAMAVGLPVISTFHSGIPEIIEDGISGLLVPERDAVQLADRIARLVAQPATWVDLAAPGRRAIETHFDLARQNDALSELLSRLAAAYRKQ